MSTNEATDIQNTEVQSTIVQEPESEATSGVIFEPSTTSREGAGCLGISIVGGCLISAISVVAMPIIVTAFVIITGLNTLGGIWDSITSIFDSEPTTATVTSTQTVVNSVRPLGQLVSVSAQLAKADISVSVRQGFQNSCGHSANHVAQGTVEAGVNLNGLTEESVIFDAANDTYTIMLPQPQLTSCRMDFISQYDRSTTVCGTNWDNVRQLAQYEGLLDFRDDSIEGGILDRARADAELTLSNFLSLATNQSVVIAFTENDGIVFPPSCTPEMPENWVYNEESDSWSR